MKLQRAKIYTFFIVLVIAALVWKLIDAKFVYHAPEATVVTLLPQQALPVWEASDSASLADSRATLETQITAQAYLVMDIPTRTVLAEKNADTLLPPASTTKLMTALTALDMYALNEKVVVSTAAAQENDGGGLFPMEELTVRDLVIGLLVSSANDSAAALAEHAPGGQTQFLERMNLLGRKLHLDQAVFQNPVGYDDPPNMLSARDLGHLMLTAIDNPLLLEWMGTPQAMVFNTAHTIRHILFTTNELLAADPQVIAGKTGTTDMAGEVLVSVIQDRELLLLIVVMGSQDRYADTQLIRQWVTENIKKDTISPWLPDQFSPLQQR